MRAPDDHIARPNPPLSYSDGVVTIRRQELGDVDASLEAIDEEQIRWLWEHGQREQWEAKTPAEKRAHITRWLEGSRDAFGPGPKWAFAVDTRDCRCVAYIDCNLASPTAPKGEANIAYSCHPAHRSRGYVSRALRLVLRFVAEHTEARWAHVVVARDNVASLRVARAVITVEPEQFVGEYGRPHLRFRIALDPR